MEKNTVMMIAADQLGRGEEELGVKLMTTYLYSLTEADQLPKTMFFMNRGVFLTTHGSPAEEHVKALAEAGVEIFSCGTCLEYYGLQDKLLVGEVTNMYSVVEALTEADHTVVLS